MTRPNTARAAALLRRHWLFALLLVAGIALRVVVTLAYRPAIFGPDSYWYLDHAAHLSPAAVRPIGYSVFLRMLPLGVGLGLVALVQHVLGLAIAVLLYAFLRRSAVAPWLAALATAPVLLDAYQLNIEEQILSETVTELLLVGALVLLLWRRPAPPWLAAAAGVLLAAATLSRAVFGFAFIPAVLVALAARPRLLRTLALVLAFAIPVGAYAAWFHSANGRYALSSYDGRFLYGRALTFADCSRFSVPRAQRVLCPGRPENRGLTMAKLLWSSRSPIRQVRAPHGETPNDVAGSFSRRAIVHQPLAYLHVTGLDFLRAFEPVKRGVPGRFDVEQWRFQRAYPVYLLGSLCRPDVPQPGRRAKGCLHKREKTDALIREYGGTHGSVRPGLTAFLRPYGRFTYTPGPLLAAALLVALVAAVGVAGARRAPQRAGAFLFATAALLLLAASVATTVFSWRYQLPQVVLAPPAGALGLSALLAARRRAVAPEETRVLRPTETASERP